MPRRPGGKQGGVGGFAPFAVVRDDMAMVLDQSADLAAAVALPVAYTTAWVGLVEEARMAADDVLLVHGAAGGVGLAAVQVGRALGARVIATASTASKRALAQNHGADATVDYGNAGWVEAVKEATDGSGVDIVFDTVGGTIGEESLRCMAWGGRLLVVGFASGAVPKLPGHLLLLRRLRAIGVYWNHDQDGEMLTKVGGQIGKLFSTGSIRPHLDRSHSFEALPRALAALADRTTMGKVVLTVSEARL